MIKTAIFVDVQNIYYTTRQAFGRQFNYRAFWQQISADHDIVLANAYAIQRSDDQQHKFQTALKHIGFNVKLKPFIQRADGSAKGDWDVGITIDVMQAAAAVDKVILLSGDGDFDLLMHHISAQHGVTTQALAVASLTANSLKASVDSFTAIDDSLLLASR
ncbi:NYN domain-containing protein [Thalassotalea euphylliae]|uniref:NYN domain-containing protein n=1 Tax=Thalassotalea euphylliae TaxID=1655234 RepID=A0A3E0TKV6_9GAMM|nr:NYN domain-containing protein [Thalassotalea euphylliae]REL25148.1 NYN domain-containing protein [Thalassotalea euphylliae]